MTTSSDQVQSTTTNAVTKAELDLICNSVGFETVAYLLNAPDGKAALESERGEAFLSLFRTFIAGAETEPETVGQMFCFVLCQRNASGTTLGRQMRQAHGGELPERRTDESIDTKVQNAVEDFFPFFLSRQDSPHTVSGMLTDHGDRHLQLAQAFMADENLATLFPGYDAETIDATSVHNIIADIFLTHTAGTVYLSLVIGNLVAFTLLRMRLAGDLSVTRVPDFVSQTMRDLRRLVDRQAVQVPCLFGLTGAHFESAVTGSGWSVLPVREYSNSPFRRIEDRDLDRLNVGAILTTTRLLAVVPRSDDEKDDGNVEGWRAASNRHGGEMSASRTDTQQKLDTFRLALLMSKSTTDGLRPLVTGWNVVSPIDASTHFLFSQIDAAPHAEVITDHLDVDATYALCQSIPDSLWLGCRRILKAASERTDPVDAFVDAVISWENMVGSGEGETNLRVCGGLAALLCPDSPHERSQLFKELKRLYGLRSKIVHGALHPTYEESHAARERAIAVSLAGMREILARSELRSATSTDRSRILLLGA